MFTDNRPAYRHEKTNFDRDPATAKSNCRAVVNCGAIPGGECFAGCDAKLPEKITLRSPHPHPYCEKRPNLGKMLLAIQDLRRQGTAQKKKKGNALQKARATYKAWVTAKTRRFPAQCTVCNKWRVSGRKATPAFTCYTDSHVIALAKAENVRACEISCNRCKHGGDRCTCTSSQSDGDADDREEGSQVDGNDTEEDSDITDSEEDSQSSSGSSDDASSDSESELSEPDLD
jgi:hypothetical protein